MKPVFEKILWCETLKRISTNSHRELFISGVRGSLNAFILLSLFRTEKKIVYISENPEKLLRLNEDIATITGKDISMIFLEDYDEEYEDSITPLSVLLRSASEKEFIIACSPRSMKTKVTAKITDQYLIQLKTGEEYIFSELARKLSDLRFNRKKIVEEPMDFAVRGGLIDIYPENTSLPVRIEFYTDRIESIREFDPITQRSVKRLDEVEILPPDEFIINQNGSTTLADYFDKSVLCLIDEPDLLRESYPEFFSPNYRMRKIYLSSSSMSEELKYHKHININSLSQPSFSSNLKLSVENLCNLVDKSYNIIICCSDQEQALRTKELIEEYDEKNSLAKISYIGSSIHSGFILKEDKIAVYTEHEIFGRYFRGRTRKRKFRGISFRDLGSINYGDLMVHRKFGIGKYAGLRKITIGGVTQETVKLLYRDNDELFVNINSLNELSKYSAREGVKPSLSKLGTSQWERVKQKAKRKLKEIAGDLIRLYAERKASPGFSFSADSVWQKELEASFIYEDTPDQQKAWEEVKKDMESPYPMDRLICGDVGFGKTEIAVRASFKAVQDNKQVAILVPTTILAEQHYNTFRDRLSPWAVEVEHLSRFKTPAQQTDILKRLREGKINVIIGTHRLLSTDVRFKDLGLLIIDEEQRFGVTAKEKIKMMKKNIDVLTLTATPIPRTLNFSLLGARDLSIINTPPPNRQPIHTEIIGFDIDIIASAIEKEINRGGQVYFVNDKVNGLKELAEMIKTHLPAARISIAHGQMPASELEKVMMRFLEKKTNVLVCTKIIESGLDIPSVNTIIINHAENFGLAELYQLRGRVGRSNIKSFAYLITPPGSSLTRPAVRRLHALEEFTELGSGMNLALRDLEIRGAGNLLGAEQSGFIAEMGFETYMQILDEAMEEIKSSEFRNIVTSPLMPVKSLTEFQIESDLPVFIPESYIDDESIRLEFYRKISQIQRIEEIEIIKSELEDRFGRLPVEVQSLLKHIEIKLKLSSSGFKKIYVSFNNLSLFIDSENEDVFKGDYFQKIVNLLNDLNNGKLLIKQDKNSLKLEFKLNSYKDASEKLQEILCISDKLYKLRKNID